MPQATATVNGVEVARSDTWEVVDGNIYVRLPEHLPDHNPLVSNPHPANGELTSLASDIANSSRPTPSRSPTSHPPRRQRTARTKAMRATTL